MPNLHEVLRIFINPDNLIIEPSYLDASVQSENLVVNRESGVIRRNVPALPVYKQETVVTCFGIIGTIRLYSGDYLILITGKQKVGTLLQKDIFRVTKVDIISVAKDLRPLAKEQKELELFYLESINQLFQTDYFYFSYSYNLSKSITENLASTGQDLWRDFNPDFWFNKFLQKKMIEVTANEEDDLSSFILPIVTGFAEIKSVKSVVDGSSFLLALVSRRNVNRLGTRYFSRGIDANGNVSNFVETEQIVITAQGKIYSFKQLRGSMPIFWRQVINTKYQPKLQVLDNMETNEIVFSKHLQQLKPEENKLVLINLVNSHGYEHKPSSVFGFLSQKLSKTFNMKYIYFDFHLECSKMRWENISKLVNQLKQEGFLGQGSYSVSHNGIVPSKQNVLIRSNCMDCLDRTNVVQSEFAKHLLISQLKDAGLIVGDHLDDELLSIFKNLWADHADVISLQYSGTGALKTDFTRTGKRSTNGALSDLMNSIVRYIKNNYQDGKKQDAYDLVTGNVQLSLLYNNNYILQLLHKKNHHSLQFYAIPSLILIALFMIVYALITVDVDRYTALWVGVLVLSVRMIAYYEADFINMPTLVDPYFSPEANGTYSEYSKKKSKETALSSVVSSKEA